MFYVYITCTIYDICQNIYTYTHMYTHKHTWKILLRKSQKKLWVIFQELIIHGVIQSFSSVELCCCNTWRIWPLREP